MEFQQTNILSMVGNSDFATEEQLANYVTLVTSQSISGLKDFTTLPTSSITPTTGTQLVTKNYVDGAFVTLGTTQTITGAKTFNTNVRLNNTRQLIFGTTTGCSLSFTSPSLMVYDNQAGGTHFFFIGGAPSVDIDSGGLVIRTGKKVQFYAGSTIFENSGGNAFDTNIPSGFQYNFKINSVDKFKIHPTFGCYVTDDLNLTTQKYINWTGGSYQQEDSAGVQYKYNVPSGYNHSFTFANTEKFKISSDTNGGILTFSGGIIMREYTGFNWLLYQMPASNVLKYQVAGNDVMEVASGGTIIYESLSMRNGKRVVWDEGFTEVAHIRKDNVNKYLEYEVATTYAHRFNVNGVAQLLLDATDATFSGGIKMKAGQPIYLDDTFLGGTISSGGSGGIRFDADVGANFRFFNDSILAITIDGTNITIPSNQTLQFGVNDSNISYQAGTTSMRFKVPAGTYSHKWFNGTTEIMNLAYTTISTLNLPINNSTIRIGSTNICTISQSTTLTGMLYNVPTGYTHQHQIASVVHSELTASGLKIRTGYFIKQGSGTAVFGSSVFNNYWTGTNMQCWVDGTNVGNYTICDYRIKENIQPARPVLSRLCQIEMIEYEIKDVGIFKKHGRHHGMMAHQVQELFSELDNVVSGEKDAVNDDGDIQPQTITCEFNNLLVSAIQELNAKVEAQQKMINDLFLIINELKKTD